MSESFGARLRQQRERRQIALASVAETTKISVSLLEALERDDVVRWPAGIYRRSFVRGYAQAIGLDPETVVREFLELYPDPADALEQAQPPPGESSSQSPPTRLRGLFDRAIEAIPGHRVPRPLLDLGSAVAASKLPAGGLGPTGRPAPADQLAAASKPAATTVAPTGPAPHADLTAAAEVCTDLARVANAHDVPPLLERAAHVLDAIGLIVWVWDPHQTALRPALAHGYNDQVLAQLPAIHCDADNATAMAFRSGQTRIVQGSGSATGALVVPLMTPSGCGGVFAVEWRNGLEQDEIAQAIATIFAAQLATLVGFAPVSRAVNE